MLQKSLENQEVRAREEQTKLVSLFQSATTRNGSRPPTCLGQCVYKGECWGPTVSDTVYFETLEAYIQLRSYSEPFLQMSDSSVFIQTSSEHPVVTCHPVNHRSHRTVTRTQTGNWRTCGGKPTQTTGEHARHLFGP